MLGTINLPAVDRNTLLIIGNGLNRAVDNSGSWNQLLAALIKRTGYGDILKTSIDELSVHTNFVTLYQELALHWLKIRQCNDDMELKQLVSELISDFEDSVLNTCDLHQALMNLPCRNTLTTNYDYALEFCNASEEDIEQLEASDSETTYSLYRCVHLANRNIWHIHGERMSPKSINLGHVQYAGYLQYARQYLINGIDSSRRDITEPLALKITGKASFEKNCWLDWFFKSDKIVWLGISLPPAEYVLWWLIFARAEAARKYRNYYDPAGVHFVDVYDPKEHPDTCWQREERNRMLTTAGMQVHQRPLHKRNGWADTYEEIIEELHG